MSGMGKHIPKQVGEGVLSFLLSAERCHIHIATVVAVENHIHITLAVRGLVSIRGWVVGIVVRHCIGRREASGLCVPGAGVAAA